MQHMRESVQVSSKAYYTRQYPEKKTKKNRLEGIEVLRYFTA